jgi:hypothetical protein
VAGMKKVIFGLGTGRCGTMSLANLLNFQEDCLMTHELGGLPWLPWEISEKDFQYFFTRVLNRRQTFVGDVSLYSLPYWRKILEYNPESKFIIIKRDKSATIESYIKKTEGQNPFMKHDGTKWRHYEWDRCYPKMNCKSKEEAISLYYDYYYDLCLKIPEDSAFWISTNDLNNENRCLEMLEFCGFDAPRFKIFKKNEGGKK